MDRLHKRYTRSSIPVPADVTGNSLLWRLLGDSLAAAKALRELWNNMATVYLATDWRTAVQAAMALDWLSTYPPFNEQGKQHMADLLIANCDDEMSRAGLSDPQQVSYHNRALRSLAQCVITFTVAARLCPKHERVNELRDTLAKAVENVLEQVQLVSPDGSSHESMDYMRITWVPLVLIAEAQRTLTGQDPAEHFAAFRDISDTYLYKMLPDETLSREGDNEYPPMNADDTVLLGYAINRFHDQTAAWLLRATRTPAFEWRFPVMEFLWNDQDVHPADPRKLPEGAYARHFRGVDQVVFRTGFGEKQTRIEFDCGPFFAKHQHMDRGHFTIHHRGHLAIDSGADYTDSESPHYLNYYRRTVAHNTMLVYDPEERFSWGDPDVRAANDGGQRMDSSRYWNTIRSVKDWEDTQNVWDLGHLRAVDTGIRATCIRWETRRGRTRQRSWRSFRASWCFCRSRMCWWCSTTCGPQRRSFVRPGCCIRWKSLSLCGPGARNIKMRPTRGEASLLVKARQCVFSITRAK